MTSLRIAVAVVAGDVLSVPRLTLDREASAPGDLLCVWLVLESGKVPAVGGLAFAHPAAKFRMYSTALAPVAGAPRPRVD